MNNAGYMPEARLHGMLATVAGLLFFAAAPAFAHHAMDGATPQTFGQGLLSGLAHPIIGLDHFAFLVVAVLLASVLKGAGRFLAPLAFIGATVAGTVVHLGEANIPLVETLVAMSVVVGSSLVLTRRYPGALALSVIFTVSGILHGYAYGESIVGAEATPLLAYLAGFSSIQYALVVGGILGMDKLAGRSGKTRMVVARLGGVVTMLTGGAFLALSAI